MKRLIFLPCITLIIGLAFGILIGSSLKSYAKCETGIKKTSNYKPNVKVVQPISASDYVDFELNPVAAKYLTEEDEVPLFVIKAMKMNPLFDRYKDNPNVRKVIDSAKDDGKINYGEYKVIRNTVRDEYMRTNDKEERANLTKLVEEL